MSLKDTFCPSPWFHMRINNVGEYEYCRWATKHDRGHQTNIKQQTPIHWFQHGMQNIRKSLLEGQSLPGCSDCYLQDTHSKVSGRQRQLLKVGVTIEDFEKTMISSPWFDEFQKTQNLDSSDQMPQDWQIDLGNFCNSACVFCTPYSSSRLAAEFKRIGLINRVPANSWCDDPDNLALFIDTLNKTPKLAYLHFIGGETLITPAFETILQALIANGLSKKISIGFTTNLTTWKSSTVDMLTEFKEINLGMSLECLHPLNDYVRYGGDLNTTIQLLEKWLETAREHSWLVQLRITPTILSIWHLDTVYEFASQQGLAVESCNFLDQPAFMRPSVLPPEYRTMVLHKLQSWIKKQACHTGKKIINTRDPNNALHQVIEDATSYINYLTDQDDESHRLPDLVTYLKKLEQSRKNSILDFLPEYEELLRTAGY